MTSHYEQSDAEVVDYQLYQLDPSILDPESKSPLLLRGPTPKRLDTADFFVCIGGAHTFGRFCAYPFPYLLSQRLNLECLNLGRGGAGPRFFSQSHQLLQYINRARFAVVQVMSGRSESNSLFKSAGLNTYVRISDGVRVGADEAFQQVLNDYEPHRVKAIVNETRRNWVRSLRELLHQIHVPSILFWFSKRRPNYEEHYGDVYQLFGEFPQLVNGRMIDAVKSDCDAYVECVSRRGLPHKFVSRFDGDRVTIRDPWGGHWAEDSYYGSPEMHLDAAEMLNGAWKSLKPTS